MRDRKWAIVVPMMFCFLMTAVSIGLCAQELKQESAAAHTGQRSQQIFVCPTYTLIKAAECMSRLQMSGGYHRYQSNKSE